MLPFLDEIDYAIDHDTVRDDALTDNMESEQVVKAKFSINFSLFSNIGDPERVSHLNLSAASLGGDDIKALGIDTLSLSVSYARKDKPQAGSLFPWPQNTKIRITGSVSFQVEDDGGMPYMEDAVAALYTARVKTLSFTLNGTAVTLPILLTNCKWTAERDGNQMFSADFGPRKPTSGVYPVAPTGTSTLFATSLNAFRAALAVVINNAATGESVAANCIFDKADLEIRDGQLVPVKYSMVSVGAFTVTALGS